MKIYKGIGKDVALICSRTVDALSKVSQIPEFVDIQIVPSSVVSSDNGYGFGVFFVEGDYVSIAIAGKYCNAMKSDGVSRKDWLETIPEVIVHEWAHMEQWRDSKRLNHKGINKRIKELLKSI